MRCRRIWRRVKELVTCGDEKAATGIQDPLTERLCRETCELGKEKKKLRGRRVLGIE